MKRLLQNLLILSALLWGGLSVRAFAEETRVFTNKNGDQIEATFLEIVENRQVRIKRQSDGREFLFDIQSLSLDDQQYLADQLAAAGKSGERRGTLLVEMPNPRDSVSIFSERIILDRYSNGASKSRLPMPAESWVLYDPEEVYGNILIPYFGASNWKIEVDEDRAIWLTRDGGDRELVGVSFDSSGESVRYYERQLRDLDLSLVKHTFSVGYYSRDHLEAMDRLPSDLPLALAPYSDLQEDEIRPLQKMNLRALHCEVDSSALTELDALEDLEMLALKVEDHDPGEPLTLPPLANLKHLVLVDHAEQVKWDETLALYPELQSLVVGNYSGDKGEGGTPITTFELNPNLKMLAVLDSRNQFVVNEAIATATGLEFLRVAPACLMDPTGGYPGLDSLRNLQFLHLLDRGLEDKVLEELFESGALEELTDFTGYYVPEFEFCPKIESISVYQISSMDRIPKFERFSEAPPTLSKIYLASLSVEDFEKVALAAPENLLSLNLSNCDVEDPELLYRFPSLENLLISRNDERVTMIDLEKFPNLSYLYLSYCEQLKSLSGFSSHIALEECHLYSCQFLNDFGEPAPNTSIRSLNFTNNPALVNFDGLSGLTGLQYFYLYRCENVESYDELESNNELVYLYVRECPNLDDVFLTPDT